MKFPSRRAYSILAGLFLAAATGSSARAQTILLQYTFASSPYTTPTTVASGITAGNISFLVYAPQWSFPSSGELQCNPGAGTTVALAVASGRCASFTLSCTNPMNLTGLTLAGAYGQFSSPGGNALQSSADGYASVIASNRFTTQVSTFATYSNSLTGSSFQGITNITFHLYGYCANSGEVYFTNITVYGSAGVQVSAANTTISANPTSIPANGTSTSTLTVQAVDTNNNNMTSSGGTVALSASSGTLSAVTDNGNGTYTATLTSSTTVGTANITGTIGGVTIGHPTSVNFAYWAGVSGANTTISANPASIMANGTSTSTLTVQAKDVSNNNLSTSSGTVTLSASAGSVSAVSDNGDGTYTATLTSSTTVGTANITGTIGGATIGHPASVNFTPGPVSAANTTISANPASIPANGTSTSTLTVQAVDANNNNLTSSGGMVTLSTSAGSVGAVTDNGNGTYTATLTSSTTIGTANITGTIGGAAIGHPASVTFATPSDISNIIPNNRLAAWNPGLNSMGGIPYRTTIYTTINAATYGNGSSDATSGIQAAINSCPAGQVVQLSAGTFTINSDIIYVNKGITLRGAGSKLTILQRRNGTVMGSYTPNADMPLIIVGPNRWMSNGTSNNLAADTVAGAYTCQLASSSPGGGLQVPPYPGQILLIDELSGAQWSPDPLGYGSVWAPPDYRVVYAMHNPSIGGDDPTISEGWYSRFDRVTCEHKEVASYDPGTMTITFTTPFTINYRASHTAQVFEYAPQDEHIRYAGVEDLQVQGGDNGNLRFERAAYCWAARVETTLWLGDGFDVDNSFRVEIRDSSSHSPVWYEPGGGSYCLSLSQGSSEVLIENNIHMDADKVMVVRACGAGSVVGYNYMDDGFIGSGPNWVEIGLNASHEVGSHHVLFEGNYGFNADSDDTHGSCDLLTFFRNHLSGQRHMSIAWPASFQDGGPLRCVGLMGYSYWESFVGNVLGRSGQMSGWVYESGWQNPFNRGAIWMLGWYDDPPYPVDTNCLALTIRHGNFDYLSNSVAWDPTISDTNLPNSLYLSNQPAFFAGYIWPWVQPAGATNLYSLPAQDRFNCVIHPPALNLAITNGVATISWNTELDKIYQVYGTTNLGAWPTNNFVNSTNWAGIPVTTWSTNNCLFEAQGNGYPITFVCTNGTANAQFFRVGVYAPAIYEVTNVQ